MIKEIKIPIYLLKTEALLRRIPSYHPKRQEIEEDYAKNKAGYKGEQSLRYYFDYLPQKEYYIFHNLRLFDGIHYFQIDFLLINKKFILILEVKNIKGTIFFDNRFNQLIRTYNGKEDGFHDPILQARTHQSKLESWLNIVKFSNIPIEYLVVITNPKTIIKTNTNNQIALEKVTLSNNLFNKINEIEVSYKEEKLNNKDIKKLSSLLLKQDTPLNPQLLEQFNIKISDLLTGVLCMKCEKLTMKRISGSWFCPTCSNWDKDAHVNALNDYYLLVNTTINNKEMRKFLHIPTRSVASKLLNSLELPFDGEGKARRYALRMIDS